MDVLTLDGSYGEGGGQILRTTLSLSAVTARPFRLTSIRAGRRNPGLLPHHLSAVRAAATISGATVSGDRLGSTELSFSPTQAPRSGAYVFDVAETAGRGSAGSVSLILQTLLLPLALADGASTVVLRGGTHVEWSPSFHDLVNGYFPALRRIAFRIDAELRRWGFYPVGNGEIACAIGTDRGAPRLDPIEMADRGPLREVAGTAVAANLPARIPQRMADRARASLADLGVPINIVPQRVTAAGPGAGIFLVAKYENMEARGDVDLHPFYLAQTPQAFSLTVVHFSSKNKPRLGLRGREQPRRKLRSYCRKFSASAQIGKIRNPRIRYAPLGF